MKRRDETSGTRTARGNADVLITADARDLAVTRPPRGNPGGGGATKRPRKSRPQFEVDPEALTLYAGNESLLVRTALIRSRDWKEGLRNPPVISSSRDVVRLCKHIAYSAKEVATILVLDARKRVLAIHETGVGGISSVPVNVPSVLQAVLLTNATDFVLVHNHPSGDPSPSEDDIHLTRNLAMAAACIGANMVDSIIVAQGGSYSMLDAGMMSMREPVEF